MVALGCSHRDPPPPAPSTATHEDPATRCFETHGQTSKAASEVFERRNLQGGGPTWAAVLEVVVRRHGTVGAAWTTAPPVGFGAAFDVIYRDTRTWYVTDDEAEGAVFCAGSPALLGEVSADFAELNRDPALLERALDEANPAFLE